MAIAFCSLCLIVLSAVQMVELFGLPFGIYSGSISQLTGSELTLLAQLADANEKALSAWLEARRSDVYVVAKSPCMANFAAMVKARKADQRPQAIVDWLDGIRSTYSYAAVRIVDPATGLSITGASDDGATLSLSRAALDDAGRPGIDESIAFSSDPDTRSVYLHVIRQVGQELSPDEKPLLLLDFTINLEAVLKPILDNSIAGTLGKSGEIVLVDNRNRFLTTTKYPMPDGSAVTPLNTVNAAGKPTQLAVEGGEGNISAADYRGVIVMAAYRHIPINPEVAWGMVVKIDESEVLAPIRKQQLQSVIFLMAAMIITVGCSLLIARRLSRPLQKIGRVAADIEAGDLDQRVPLEGTTETIELAQSFNAMVYRLKGWQEELEQKVSDRTIQLIEVNRDLEREISVRREAEHTLLLFKVSVENATDAIGISTTEGKHYYQNKAFDNLFGEIGENPQEVYQDADVAREVFDTIMAGNQWAGEVKMFGKDKSVKDILLRAYANRDADGRVIGLVGIHTDITYLKQAEVAKLNLERQLLHAQKMESLGVLAGGIAHDFNNILTSIVGNTDLAIMRLAPESPVIENLRKVEQAAMRASDLAKQMLAYSGKGKFVIESIDLNRLVEEMGHMLEVSISKKAIMRFNLTKPLPSIEADATQIRQIVLNLVINASEAIGNKSGFITVSTGCIDCESDYLKSAWLNTDIPEGRYVYLEVSDTGCGMDRETQSKLFDPFFTTKFTGRGLGMAAVQGIVRGHRGAIKVYSELGKGSSFKILLPACTEAAGQHLVDAGAVEFKGEGTILLVDDEETILDVGSQMIKELGFSVITAIDGRDAVEKFRSQQGVFCVILDLTMPHMDGEQTFRELRIFDPNVKVVVSSGYSEYEVTQKFTGKGLAGFIQKPFKLSTLKEVLQRI